LTIEGKCSVALRALLDPYPLLAGVVQNIGWGAAGFLPTADTYDIHFPLDGSTYTPAQLNSSGFGVAIRDEFHSDFNTDDATVSIDDVVVEISFSSSIDDSKYPIGGTLIRDSIVGDFARSEAAGTFERIQ
jgi:hypothetical protein